MAIEARTRVPSAATNGKKGHTLISDDKFRQLYGLALKLRLLTQRGNGARGLVGREAVLAAVAADLRPDDGVLTREGVLLAEALGKSWPGPRGADDRGLSERVIEAVSGAVADRMKKSGRVAVIFSQHPEADPALEEARRIADAAKLPVLFVEDWREAESPEARNGKAVAQEPGAMPVIPVDAQDVVAIYRVAHESISRARQGMGPTRIQCLTWKPAGNGRRAAEPVDPVGHLEQWLEARGLPAHAWRQQISAEFGRGKNGAGLNGRVTAQAR